MPIYYISLLSKIKETTFSLEQLPANVLFFVMAIYINPGKNKLFLVIQPIFLKNPDANSKNFDARKFSSAPPKVFVF